MIEFSRFQSVRTLIQYGYTRLDNSPAALLFLARKVGPQGPPANLMAGLPDIRGAPPCVYEGGSWVWESFTSAPPHRACPASASGTSAAFTPAPFGDANNAVTSVPSPSRFRPSLYSRCLCVSVANLPFLFINLRVAPPATPFFSQPSALPGVAWGSLLFRFVFLSSLVSSKACRLFALSLQRFSPSFCLSAGYRHFLQTRGVGGAAMHPLLPISSPKETTSRSHRSGSGLAFGEPGKGGVSPHLQPPTFTTLAGSLATRKIGGRM